MHATHVVHFRFALALGNLDAQVGLRNVGAVLRAPLRLFAMLQKFIRYQTVTQSPDYRRIWQASPGTSIGVTMNDNRPAYFDLETVALLREVLDDTWTTLRPDQRATMLKTTLAERILASAAQGERDRERLLDAALSEFVSEEV